MTSKPTFKRTYKKDIVADIEERHQKLAELTPEGQKYFFITSGRPDTIANKFQDWKR